MTASTRASPKGLRRSRHGDLVPTRLALLLLCALVGRGLTSRGADSGSMPAGLAACFRPPDRFANERDNRRSPLLRPDGSRITTLAEWVPRRGEIRTRWFELLGPWR